VSPTRPTSDVRPSGARRPFPSSPAPRFAPWARAAGGADAHIGNMATEDFLGCLSKAGIEKVGSGLRVLPRPRAKDTRAEVIKQASGTTYVHPAALFALTEAEVALHAEAPREYPWSHNDPGEANEEGAFMGHADRSSRSMLLKVQADRFAVDLIPIAKARRAAAIRATVIRRAGARLHGAAICMPPPCAEPRGPGAHLRTLTPTAWAHLLHTHQHGRRPNKDSGRFCRSMPLPSSHLY